MKLILLLLAVVFVAVSGFSSNEPTSTNSTTNSTAKNYQTMDLKQFDGLQEQSKVKVNVSMKCKSDSGLEYKAGDMGYEQCVKSSSKNGSQNVDQKSQNNGTGNTGTMEVTF